MIYRESLSQLEMEPLILDCRHTEIQEITFKPKKIIFFSYKMAKKVEQFAQKDLGVIMLRDIKNLKDTVQSNLL